MKTDRLIDLLAADAMPVAHDAAGRRMGLASVVGLAMAFAIVGLDYGFRRDLGHVVTEPMFWVKCGLPLVVALAGFQACTRLGRPGVRVGAWKA